MADKPAQICQLKKGEYLGLQKGCVDTFNWAVQAIANLKGGQNCEVNWDMPDHPTIDVTTHEDEVGGGGGGSELEIIGTDDSIATESNSQFQLSCASDSNIVISCDGNVLTFGVYYI